MPNIRHIPSDNVIMLGAPVGGDASVDLILNNKLATFRLLASRLTSLHAQDALFLLKSCFSTPKLLYMLRCAACYKSAVLSEYDGVIRDTLKIVLNVDLTDDIWKQATLPVSKGGLGVRLASDLALPAFLSSVNGASELTLQLLPARLHALSSTRDPVYIAANQEWQLRSNAVVPDGSRIGVQKAWDTPLVNRKLEEVISAAQTQVGRARLIAAAAPHSGDFLHAIPCSAVGTRLDNTSFSHRRFTASRGHHVCTAHVRLRRRSRLLRDSRSCLSQVRRSSHATQRRQ